MKLITLDDLAPYIHGPDESPNIKPAANYVDEVIDKFYGDQAKSGSRLPWGKSEFTISFRPGEVSLWLGMNGHGKSLLLGQLLTWWMAHDEACCIASFEMKPATTLQRMCRQAAQCNEPSIQFIQQFHRWTDSRLWMYDQQGTVSPDRVLSVCRFFADKMNGQHIVIDSLMKCGMGEDDYNGQKRFVDELTSIARDYNIHIHLVHHSRKLGDENSPPGKMDAKGTGAITDQVDNCISVWRNKKKEKAAQNGNLDMDQPDSLMIVDKQRNGEWEGSVALWFNRASGQFVGSPSAGTIDLLRPRQ